MAPPVVARRSWRRASWHRGPARSGADDQRHHILMLPGAQPDPVGPAWPLRWHLERQAGLPARVGQVILVEVRRSVLIRPDREAFRARAPVPPGHAQRRRVDQRSVTPARAAVADPVRWERRVRAEAPLVAQRADARGGRVGRERSQAGRWQRARKQPRRVDLPVEAPLHTPSAHRGTDADDPGRRARGAQIMRPGVGRDSRGDAAGDGAAPGAARQDNQGDRACAVPAGRHEVPVPGLEHRAGG